MQDQLVSVALTTSKSQKYLVKQVDSILKQTYKNIEVCVSHDECGDETVSILKRYASQDKRFKWEYNPLEKGFIKNTEHAISMCKGDIIFLCDHDDWWDLSRVQEHLNIYKSNPDVSWVYNNSILVDGDDLPIGRIEDTIPNYFSSKKLTLLNMVWGTCIGAAHTSYRATDLKKTLPIPLFVPAHDSWIQLMLHPKKSFFINKDLYFYRQHGANQVGWAKEMTDVEYFLKEKEAIKDNMIYLKKLYQYPR
ncbi:MAG: hypothetical protein RLZZ308_154, partial [Candidatus Parcubacteria bacterium]